MKTITTATTNGIWKQKLNNEDNDSDDNDLRNNVYWYCKPRHLHLNEVTKKKMV